MATKIEVTNEDVLRFYADKFADEEHCPITAKYLSKLEEEERKNGKELRGYSLHGDYVSLVNTFKKGFIEKEYKNKTKDEKFYDWLKIREIVSFSFCLPDVFLEHTDYYDVALQKWHLYVSWYAYLESGIMGEGLCLEKKMTTFKCEELLLWMCEAADVARTKDYCEEALQGKSDWKALAREEIRNIIKGSKEEKSWKKRI